LGAEAPNVGGGGGRTTITINFRVMTSDVLYSKILYSKKI